EADAAIAHDCCRDAVLRGRRDVLAPGDLAVIMGVDVDKAGRDQFAFGVDLFLALRGNPADFGDAAAGDRHIGFEQFATLDIGNGAAADHEVGGRGHGFHPGSGFVGASSDVPPHSQPPGMRLRNASAGSYVLTGSAGLRSVTSASSTVSTMKTTDAPNTHCGTLTSLIR